MFEPIFVSIGPYHHGKEHLRPMEVHKRRAVRHFVERWRLPVQEYKNALMVDVKKLQESYDQLDEEYLLNPDKFIELMMVDGCFILEFMDILSGALKDDYAPNDPVYSYYGCIIHYNRVMRDLLLLENQLPYLVLEKLVSVSQLTSDPVSQHEVRAILSQMMMFDPDMDPGRHMLDMFITGFLQGPATPDNEADRAIHLSASQLYHAGIKFNKIRGSNDISFDRHKATLNLPHLNINEYSISFLMNLKAFEPGGTTNRNFNSYLQLMDSLVKSVEDVKLLESHRIITNFLPSNEAVVKLLNDLARDTVVDKNCESYIARKEMTRYYNIMMINPMRIWKIRTKMHIFEWMYILRQTYFNNPWTTIISVVAAASLLAMTAAQTIYTVRSFYTQQK
ncbi:putative transmembrane protein [Thalictrum thalictroides]|uniref:Putative transmembrane protein n=1 Tax=Thalictrum thalictroides TaxID=46969 RepID=A0A7J6WCC2_THATH|nr:putative transmembrane protein [Thalictrum thalictroides]